MKKLVIALALVLGCVGLTGCGKKATFVPLPTEAQKTVDQPAYNAIVQTDLDGVETLVGFPKEYSGGELEAIIGIGNPTEYPIFADASNFKIYYGAEEPIENPIQVLGYENLQTGVKIKNFFDKLAIGTVVGLAAVGAAASGHHYETSTFSGSYTGPYYGQGGTFVGSVTTHYYDAEENRRNCEAVAESGASVIEKTKIRCENRYAALAAEYFGSENIPGGRSLIKKIVVKGLSVDKENKTVTAEIYAGGVTKTFTFILASVDDEGNPLTPLTPPATASDAEPKEEADANTPS